MAGIKMDMVLTDKVSPALRKMSTKIETLIRRLDSINESSKKVTRNLDKLAASANAASARTKKAAADQNKLKGAVDGVSKSVQKLANVEQRAANAGNSRTAQELLQRLKASVKMQNDAVKREAFITSVMEKGGQKRIRAIQKETAEVGKALGKKLKAHVASIQSKNKEAANFNNKTMSMRVAADKFINSYINGIRRRQAASDKAAQKEVANQNKIKKAYSSTNHVWAALKRGTTAYLGVQSLGGVINTSDSLTMAKARMNVVGDGVHSTEELMNMIYGASMRSRSGYLDMAASVSKVAMQAGSLFRSGGKQNNAAIVQFMENYNKMAAISGATQQQTSAAMLQIVQALSSGELRGDELRSVLENMPVVADYLAKKMGVARDQILSLGHDGKISAETLRDAVMGATDDLNEKMKKMPYTWGQVWTIFKNAALKAFEPVLNGISAILKNEKFLEFANGLGRALLVAGQIATPVFNAVGTAIGWVYDKLKAMYNFVKDNISTIAPIFIGIASALALYYSWVGAVWLATKTWAAVQAVLNAIMAMTPLMWIVVAIGAVIAAVYLLVDAGTSGTGVLVGAAYWLWEVICNIGRWIANMFSGIVQEIVNRWTWMCDNTAIIFDNIGTFWDNLWINCRIGLNNFVAWAVGKLASLAESVSPIAEALGVDVSGLNKVANKAANKADSLAKNKGSYKSLIAWSDRGSVNWEKYKYGDLSDAYDRGYKVGADFENSVKEKFKGLSEYFGEKEGETNDFYKALTGGFDNPATSGATGNPTLDKISGDTGDIANNTGKSEEDFSYLRELAEREAINKYTLTDLKIDMTNNNNISNGVDSDSVMKRLAKQLSEAVLSTAEGITPW